jgi:hypothetical protein
VAEAEDEGRRRFGGAAGYCGVGIWRLGFDLGSVGSHHGAFCLLGSANCGR